MGKHIIEASIFDADSSTVKIGLGVEIGLRGDEDGVEIGA